MSLEDAGKDLHTSSKGQTLKEERKPERRTPFSMCDLHIIEPEDQISHPVKDASTSFNPAERWMKALQTHI